MALVCLFATWGFTMIMYYSFVGVARSSLFYWLNTSQPPWHTCYASVTVVTKSGQHVNFFRTSYFPAAVMAGRVLVHIRIVCFFVVQLMYLPPNHLPCDRRWIVNGN